MEELTGNQFDENQGSGNQNENPLENSIDSISSENQYSDIPDVNKIGANHTEMNKISEAAEKIRDEIHKVIIGQDDMIDLLMVGFLAGGHVLLEGVPGIAKTLTAKLLAQSISVDFSRIQFTPDLMPADIIGTSVFNMKTSDFNFNKGPIFSNIVLIDEINRSPAKTQAALFEVMEEKQITVDSETYIMDEPFFVIATQNPIEQEGTYKLPEAQLDRFLFKIKLTYPTYEEEREILHKFKEDFEISIKTKVNPVISAKDITELKKLIEKVHIKDSLVDYIAQIVDNTRNNGDLFLGASPRASLAMMKTAKTLAAIKHRDFVTPDDIQTVAYPVMNHRLLLSAERELEGTEVEDVIKDIIKKIEVPR